MVPKFYNLGFETQHLDHFFGKNFFPLKFLPILFAFSAPKKIFFGQMVQVLYIEPRVVKLRDQLLKSLFDVSKNFFEDGPEVLQQWVRNTALGPFFRKIFFCIQNPSYFVCFFRSEKNFFGQMVQVLSLVPRVVKLRDQLLKSLFDV